MTYTFLSKSFLNKTLKNKGIIPTRLNRIKNSISIFASYKIISSKLLPRKMIIILIGNIPN